VVDGLDTGGFVGGGDSGSESSYEVRPGAGSSAGTHEGRTARVQLTLHLALPQNHSARLICIDVVLLAE
jgi:hypothetical protein